jgi:hypothetical protein
MPEDPRPHQQPEHPIDEVSRYGHAPKPLITVNFEREVDVVTGKGETRRFVKMYFEARDSGLLATLPDELWKTLCVLATYLDENGHCFPSQERIAKDLGIGRQAVNKRIQRLREFRFAGKPLINISRSTVPQGVGGTRRDKNSYQLYPIAGFRFGGDQETAKTPADALMSPQRDIRANTDDSTPRCRPRQTSGEGDTNKNNEGNDLNVNVERIASNEIAVEAGTSFIRDPRTRTLPPISYDALRRRYGLNDEQCGEVTYLVGLQAQFLGSAQQNHRNYVHRAATVAQQGLTGRFTTELRDFDEWCMKNRPKKGRPQLFHAIWRGRQATYVVAQESAVADATARLANTFSRPNSPDTARDSDDNKAAAA